MSDYSYYLENSDDLIVVNGDRSAYPDVSFGSTNTFEFFLKDPIKNTRTSSKTVYDTASTVYNRLKEYEEFAGYVTTGQTLNETYFSESRGFANNPIPGLVMSISPGDDVNQATGVWGLIKSIDDTTEVFDAVARLSIELFVVGEIDDYTAESDVRTQLEAPL